MRSSVSPRGETQAPRLHPRVAGRSRSGAIVKTPVDVVPVSAGRNDVIVEPAKEPARASGSMVRFRLTIPLAASFLMIIATVSWRHKVYFTGGLDPVVLGKGALSVLALGLAWTARQRCAHPRPMGSRYVWLLLAYLSVSVFGAWSTGELVPTAILAVRLVILATTVIFLIRSYSPETVLRALFTAMLVVALVGTASGVATVASGRLEGGIPPLNPNEIAMLLGPPAIGILWLILTGRSKAYHGVLLAALMGIIWLTGSRTALMALVVAMALMVTQVRQMKPAVAVLLAFAVGGVIYLAMATNLITDFFARGGDSNITTLSSRTIAWSAAFTFPETEWVRYMGAGIATKRIPVQGQYWDDQLLDSSWVSALVQVGYVGVLILGIWCISALIASARCAREPRMLLMSVLVLLIIRSTLESGLIDSTPAFITFVTVSLLVDKTTREGGGGLMAEDRGLLRE